jgi:Ca2+-binding RTX toxin-like protein
MQTKTTVLSAMLLGMAGLMLSPTAWAVVTCLGKPATIIGGPGNDTLYGTPGDDVIAGLAGNDSIYGDDGNDLICGGSGNDLLDGEAGNDTSNGGPGNDNFADQGGGNDSVDYRSSPGGVSVFLDNSNPSSDGYGGQDGFDNIENAYGSPYADLLNGTGDRNALYGRDGDDFLMGGGAKDKLIGGNGNDTANGGVGADNCQAETVFDCP